MRLVWVALTCVGLASSCSKGPEIECGEGTVLKGNRCVVAMTITPVASTPAPAPKPPAPATAVITPVVQPAAQAPQPPDPPQSKWVTQSRPDGMRGTTTEVAMLESDNTVRFDFPYEDASLQMYLRQKGKKQELFLVIVRGQFDCGFDGCRISVKFDDGKVQSFYANEGESTDSLFISKVGSWVSQMKKAKTMMVEADFYQEGARQFTFAPTGLVWPPSGT